MQESSDEGETEVDEVVVKVIKRMNPYHISFPIGVFISHEWMR